MPPIDYTTTLDGNRIRVDITHPNGDSVSHSIPVSVLKNAQDTQAKLEEIVTQRAHEAFELPDGKPEGVPDAGQIQHP